MQTAGAARLDRRDDLGTPRVQRRRGMARFHALSAGNTGQSAIVGPAGPRPIRTVGSAAAAACGSRRPRRHRCRNTERHEGRQDGHRASRGNGLSRRSGSSTCSAA
jgi:hypothetical protein